jgi:hypothetical protein
MANCRAFAEKDKVKILFYVIASICLSPHLATTLFLYVIRSLAASVVPVSQPDGSTKKQLLVVGGIDIETMTSSDAIYAFKTPEEVQASGEGEDEGCELSSAVGKWKELPVKLLRPRYRHGAVVYEGKLWVLGGIVKATTEEAAATAASVGATNSVDDVEKYTASTEYWDFATGNWTAGPCMTTKRAIDVTAVIVDGSMYVLGGNIGVPVASAEGGYKEVDPLGTIEKYDAQSNSFKQVRYLIASANLCFC